jgi:hypothetical protein
MSEEPLESDFHSDGGDLSHLHEAIRKEKIAAKKNERLDVYIGAVKTDSASARQFSDLVAKTLKLQL